ncbi:TolC family protein [Bacteroides cellulosilyticus]|uniref:TolC family protein n=1 Tax=Bacteroides cellulosilyticus TaxID=246787 RepID=A0A412IKW1_9BACE|nr:TolC family protein [Bacteroides cellulosilyticus]RGS38285.1 TolC family protein [Bacteroides cellulosilyticus]
MKMNLRYSILLVLLMAGAVCIPSLAQVRKYPQQDISFTEYLNRVGKSNLGYLAERLNVSIADAETVAQKVLPDPELEFEAGSDNFSLGLSYSLELGNKRGSRIRLARSRAELEKLLLEQGFQDLRADAADLFFEAILQRELLGVQNRSYQYMLQLSQSDSLRYAAGEITENDARQSKLEAMTLLNTVYTQEAAYQSALVMLNRYMGATADTLNIPLGDWEELSRDFALAELISAGLDNRIDLLAAQKSTEVSTREYKLTRAERRPDIGLSASYERDWHGFLPPARSAIGGVSVPLKFSNTNKGAIKAAKLRITQSEVRERDMELQIQAEIHQAWYNYEAEKKKVFQYKAGVLEDSRKVLDGMVYKYKRGETNILDVLVAQRTYNEVQQGYLETMKGYVASLVELERACGIWDICF